MLTKHRKKSRRGSRFGICGVDDKHKNSTVSCFSFKMNFVQNVDKKIELEQFSISAFRISCVIALSLQSYLPSIIEQVIPKVTHRKKLVVSIKY